MNKVKDHLRYQKKNNYGFTIIELLIAIVVIAILATISIVVYQGISNRANDAAVKSDLSHIHRSYIFNSIDDEFRFDKIIEEYTDRSTMEPPWDVMPIADPGQDQIKQLLGLVPNRSYYHSKTNDISVVYLEEYIDYYDQNINRYRYKKVPIFYARSASGKVFRHDGQITQDMGKDSSEMANQLRENIADYEQQISLIDDCYNGGANADECGDMSEWPPISEWQTEKEYALIQVAEWRQMLKDLEAEGYSLSKILPACGSATVFIQGSAKWYQYRADC